MVTSAKENREWVQRRVESAGLTREIEAEAAKVLLARLRNGAAMTDLTWKEPPEGAVERSRKQGTAWVTEAAAMRANPGKSLLLASFPPDEKGSNGTARTLASRIKSGHYAAMRPAGTFDALTTAEKDEQGNPVVNVYAWYAEQAEVN